MNEKKIYQTPELSVTDLQNEDILTASGGDSEMVDWEW